MQSVTSKVSAPVSLTGQRFTVQIPPPSQTATTTKTSKPHTAQREHKHGAVTHSVHLSRLSAATPPTPAVSNVLINPSLISSKNILITTNMVSQSSGGESLKRKHEDDDDYDTL